MFEVLMFLFENFMDSNATLNTDSSSVVEELEKSGFGRTEIDRALDWLEGLVYFQGAFEATANIPSQAMRHLLPEERQQLGVEGYGFLLYLEQLGIVDVVSREIIIDRLMVLDSREIDVGRVKWVVLMVLFNQPNKKSALSMLQDMVLHDTADTVH